MKTVTPIRPSHMALLVRSVERTAAYLRRFGFQIGKVDEWDGEGTKEIYVEGTKCNSLLLMEPIKPGAYKRAVDKRGSGLHHLAIDVPKLEDFLLSISSSSWRLHLRSIETISEED